MSCRCGVATITPSCVCNLCLEVQKLKNRLTPWAHFEPYEVGDRIGNDGLAFTCIKAHEGSTESMPGLGVDWRTYWVARTTP